MLYLKNDVIILTDVFQNYINTCKSEFGFNPFYFCSVSSFTKKAGLKYTRVGLDFITVGKDRILLEKSVRGDAAPVSGNLYVQRSDTGKIHFWEIININETGMCQYLPTRNFDEIEVTVVIRDNLLKSFLNTKDDHKHG